MTDFQTISNKIKEGFSFPYHDFNEPLQWSDAVGVSRTKKYANGFASLYKIGIMDQELNKDSSRKIVWVTVSYGKDTLDGVSLGKSESLFDPVDLDFQDEFTYDINTNKFYYKNKEISPIGLLSLIEKIHIKPTKIIRGFFLRLKLWFWRKFLPGLIRVLDFVFKVILWIISGERVVGDIWERMVSDWHKLRQPTPNKVLVEKEGSRVFEGTGTIDFFGYKAKRWSVVFFCLVHLLFFFFISIKKIELPILKILFENNFLTLCYIVVVFAISEALLPKFLKFLINNLVLKLFNMVAFKCIKV